MVNSVGLGAEVYMTPQPVSSKSAATQVDELVNGLVAASIGVRSVWIQVTSPINWSINTGANINFINALISRAKSCGLNVGIYTNFFDWNQITGNYMGIPSDVRLWYWNVLSGGVNGETQANFADFRRFGSFRTPSVKQFGQVQSICGLTVNRNVFAVSTRPRFFSSPQGRSNPKATAGFIGL